MIDMDAPPNLDRLRQIVAGLHPGATLGELVPLKGGNSAAVNRVTVTLPSGEEKRYVLRVPREDGGRDQGSSAHREFTLVQTMHIAGIPVQKPVHLEPRTETNATPFYLLEYCEGAPELAPADIDSYLEQYATQLARLHCLDYRSLDAIRFLGHVGDGGPETRSKGAAGMRIDEIRAAARRKPRESHANPHVLCHCDFWPGNLLWREGKFVAIIDWEECHIGEPLYDLAICRLDLRWILGPAPVERFTQRYAELSGNDLHNLAYWDLVASIRPIKGIEDWAKSYPHLGRPDVTAATMMQHHHDFVDEALRRWA